ncbi:MAG TPA: hypothetical protein VKB12_12595 [Pyrinomonadaceae bacterium]|nr:hypothetical protein [Pyrinomonadaceae bacterium]
MERPADGRRMHLHPAPLFQIGRQLFERGVGPSLHLRPQQRQPLLV